MRNFSIALLVIFLLSIFFLHAETEFKTLCSISPSDGNLRFLDENGNTVDTIPIQLEGHTVELGFGLAVNPANQQLYALLALDGGDPNHRYLVKINPITGKATMIGDTNERFAALDFFQSGKLLGITGKVPLQPGNKPETLYYIDLNDATIKEFVSLNAYGNGSIVFCFDRGAEGESAIRMCDNEVFEEIVIGDSIYKMPLNMGGYNGTSALTYSPTRKTLLMSDWTGDLYSVTYTRGVEFNVQDVGDVDHDIRGLAYITQKIVSVDVSELVPGATVTINVVGQHTPFSKANPPRVSLGDGVTITSIVVVDNEHLTITAEISPDAQFGSRTLTIVHNDGLRINQTYEVTNTMAVVPSSPTLSHWGLILISFLGMALIGWLWYRKNFRVINSSKVCLLCMAIVFCVSAGCGSNDDEKSTTAVSTTTAAVAATNNASKAEASSRSAKATIVQGFQEASILNPSFEVKNDRLFLISWNLSEASKREIKSLHIEIYVKEKLYCRLGTFVKRGKSIPPSVLWKNCSSIKFRYKNHSGEESYCVFQPLK